MKPILEFCANNASLGTGEAIRKVQEQVECDVYEYGCLTSCGTCYLFPYVLVDGEQVEGEDAKQLAERILQKIRETHP
ncbi:YuzB family protein [Paenibacillus rubinfantis]|uniref:YuzB family protein n=1 Tax=Paenibacillus rubinfantis TaxID=1720296 RepID=UPI00073E8CF9|nr:YuzB family protein [Paenibacillus rubinfantis]